MPILLTSPFNPGDVDPGASYSHVQIVGMRWFLSGSIEITIARGRIVAGVFVEGRVPRETIIVANNSRSIPPGTDYTGLLTGTPNPGETTYQAVGRGLYGHLIAKGIYPGTVA